MGVWSNLGQHSISLLLIYMQQTHGCLLNTKGAETSRDLHVRRVCTVHLFSNYVDSAQYVHNFPQLLSGPNWLRPRADPRWRTKLFWSDCAAKSGATTNQRGG